VNTSTRIFMGRIINLPLWAKKWGLVGIIIVVILTILNLAFEAIIQDEVQNFWSNNLRPYLLSSINIQFEIQNWILFTAIILLVGTVSVTYFWLNRPRRGYMGKLNPRALRIPKEGIVGEHNNVDVLRARTKVREGKLSPAEFAIIVQQTINLGNLKPDVGAEILDEYDYELILRSDRSYTTQRRRTKK